MIDPVADAILPQALLDSLSKKGYVGPEEINPAVSPSWTPLTFAASVGDQAIVRELLDLGADPNLPCAAEGRPALFYVTFADQHQQGLVNDLVSFGADLNYVDPHGLTPMTFALAHHQGPLVAFLLSLGAVLSSSEQAEEKLVFEIVDKAAEGLSVLVKRRMSPLIVDYQGNNLFHALALSHSFSQLKPTAAIRMLALLLARGVNPGERNYRGDTPLHLASRGSSRVMGDWLCRQAIEIDARNDEGSTPLLLAAIHYGRLAGTLLNKGASPLAANRSGMDVLMASFSRFSSTAELISFAVSPSKGDEKFLSSATAHRLGWDEPSGKLSRHVIVNRLSERLLSLGANVKNASRCGATALMRAARFQPEMVPLLIQAGADVNARDRSGWTALMCAAASHRAEEAVESLLQAGAHVSQATEKKSVAKLWEYNPAAQAFLDAARLGGSRGKKSHQALGRRL